MCIVTRIKKPYLKHATGPRVLDILLVVLLVILLVIHPDPQVLGSVCQIKHSAFPIITGSVLLLCPVGYLNHHQIRLQPTIAWHAQSIKQRQLIKGRKRII